MRSVLIMVLLLITFLITGCNSTKQSISISKNKDIPKDMARIEITRDDIMLLMGSWNCEVFDKKQKIGYLANGDTLSWDVPLNSKVVILSNMKLVIMNKPINSISHIVTFKADKNKTYRLLVSRDDGFEHDDDNFYFTQHKFRRGGFVHTIDSNEDLIAKSDNPPSHLGLIGESFLYGLNLGLAAQNRSSLNNDSSLNSSPNVMESNYSSMSIDNGCSSDFDCSSGQTCIKKSFSSKGKCMNSVNKFGTSTYSKPKLDSFNQFNSSPKCKGNLDCPIGFRCDSQYKVCVK